LQLFTKYLKKEAVILYINSLVSKYIRLVKDYLYIDLITESKHI